MLKMLLMLISAFLKHLMALCSNLNLKFKTKSLLLSSFVYLFSNLVENSFWIENVLSVFDEKVINYRLTQLKCSFFIYTIMRTCLVHFVFCAVSSTLVSKVSFLKLSREQKINLMILDVSQLLFLTFPWFSSLSTLYF